MGFLHDEFFISLPNEKQGVSAAAAKKNQWQDRAVLMWRIAAPIILLLGYAGNTLTIILLRRMKKQSAVYVYFGLLAVSDITNLTIGLLPRWVGHQFGYWIEDEMYRAACVVMPFRVHETCNSRTVSLTVVTLVVADTAFNSFVPFVIDYSADGCRWKKKYQEGLRPTLGYPAGEVGLDWTHPQEASIQHHTPSPDMEPAGEKEERPASQQLEAGH
nr:hypothetical protein BaRGS_032505 [Batillaria attramentaria]